MHHTGDVEDHCFASHWIHLTWRTAKTGCSPNSQNRLFALVERPPPHRACAARQPTASHKSQLTWRGCCGASSPPPRPRVRQGHTFLHRLTQNHAICQGNTAASHEITACRRASETGGGGAELAPTRTVVVRNEPSQKVIATRAEDAQGTPTQSHISPSILVYQDYQPSSALVGRNEPSQKVLSLALPK